MNSIGQNGPDQHDRGIEQVTEQQAIGEMTQHDDVAATARAQIDLLQLLGRLVVEDLRR